METFLKNCRKTLVLLALIFSIAGMSGSAQAATNVIANAVTVSGGKFVTTSKGIRYLQKNGKYLSNKWAKINGKVYRFRMDSYVFRGWRKYPAGYYYADAKGVVYHSQWLRQGNKTYFLRYNGLRAENVWIALKGNYYRFGSTGLLLKNTRYKVNGKNYYANAAGIRVKNTWVTISGKRYYYGSDGVMVAGKWVKYNNKYYYLTSSGVMATNTRVGSYYVGADGAKVTNTYVNGNYYGSNGKIDNTASKAAAAAKNATYLFVGDSRTVGMEAANPSAKAVFIAKIGMGYDWLSSTADSQVRATIKANPKLKVVFAFGINDLGNIQKYLTYYKQIMKDFPSTSFYFMSINPYDPAKWTSPWLSDAAIRSFNSTLKAAVGSKYLDTYTYLKNKGFTTFDGLHYDEKTNQIVYKNACYKILTSAK